MFAFKKKRLSRNNCVGASKPSSRYTMQGHNAVHLFLHAPVYKWSVLPIKTGHARRGLGLARMKLPADLLPSVRLRSVALWRVGVLDP